ncbi:MAG: hypothetical protein ACFFDW_16305 [Candidatus Thorarchaeota archaeon]
MVRWILSLILILLSLVVWMFVVFSIWKEYRYATLLFDMILLYPILTIISYILFTFAVIYWLVSPIYWILPLLFATLLTTFLSILCFRWISSYRLKQYERLLSVLKKEDFEIKKFMDYFPLEKGNPKKINIFIRHDVDLSLKKIVKMTALEKKYGITSTVFFRLHSNKYSLQQAIPIIKKLHQEGFEIGFHYEVLTVTKGDEKAAIEIFEKELTTLREHVPVQIVAAHGDKYKNRQIWSKLNKNKLNVFSAYDMKKNLYLSDAGGYDLFAKFGHHLYGELDKASQGDIVQILIHADWWY